MKPKSTELSTVDLDRLAEEGFQILTDARMAVLLERVERHRGHLAELTDDELEALHAIGADLDRLERFCDATAGVAVEVKDFFGHTDLVELRGLLRRMLAKGR